MPVARPARAWPGRGFLEPCSALSVVKARAFLGSATTCRANSIADRPRAFYDPTCLRHLCAPARVPGAGRGTMNVSEPQGCGVAGTEERGPSDEGPPPEAA